MLAASRRSGQSLLSKQSALAGNSTAAGLVVFWPALFFTHGHNARSASELAQLKGEIEALEGVSEQESCGIQFNRV